ncbi:MAG TPA: anthranilate phosphoribosyltransferase [Capsulimonadaceae bacterium]|nr:anthranilate phosphoribosyltransferase [Capsulimonadaceae bacterium]
MKTEIQKVSDRRDLTQREAAEAMTQIMDGSATPAQIAALAVALHMKGESSDEITGFARVMRQFAIQVPVETDKVLVDTCGTGGDSLKTFNVSTTAALIAASSGKLAMAKHGNRAATSKCGSADVLEALGVRIDLPPHDVGLCIEAVGIGFLYAPAMHPALRYAIGPRKEIGIRTFFNMLGPLTNPAGAKVQLIGVYDLSLCEMLANVLKNLGSERVLMVHGTHGLDELSTLGETVISELKGGRVHNYTLHAEKDLGLPLASIEDIAAGDTPAENAKMLTDVLEGTDRGPKRDIACLNAAGVLLVAGVVDDLAQGLVTASDLIDSGAARATLERLRQFTSG